LSVVVAFNVIHIRATSRGGDGWAEFPLPQHDPVLRPSANDVATNMGGIGYSADHQLLS